MARPLEVGNGQGVGQSQMYGSTRAMENGIASVKRHAAAARVDDRTGD